MADPIWTEADYEKLRAAIASGVLEVRYDGPPARTVRYQDLQSMRALLAEMRRDLQSRRQTSVAAFRKGF